MELEELTLDSSFDEISHYIEQLYLELFGESSVLSVSEKHQIKEKWASTTLPHWAFKVVDGGNVIAFFTLSESFSFFAHGCYGIINEFWVEPKCRSLGIGSRVLELIKQLAADKNWQRIDVSAPPSPEWTKTFEFYQDNGFVFTGKKLKYVLS